MRLLLCDPILIEQGPMVMFWTCGEISRTGGRRYPAREREEKRRIQFVDKGPAFRKKSGTDLEIVLSRQGRDNSTPVGAGAGRSAAA